MHVSGSRVLAATLLGALAMLVWGMVWWMGLGGMIEPVRPLGPDTELALSTAVLDLEIESGAYYFPGFPPEQNDETMAAWTERHKAGPIGMLLYQSYGLAPMQPQVFVRGFILNAGCCLLATLVILPGVRAGWSVPRKAAAAVCVGLAATLCSYGNLWNWMYAPSDWAVKMGLDVLGSWLFAGVVLALVLKPSAARLDDGVTA